MAVPRMQRTDDSPGHSQWTRAKVTVTPRPLCCQSVRHFQWRLTCEFWLKKKDSASFHSHGGGASVSFHIVLFLVTCLVPLTHAMAAAFNAQMGPEEVVVQLNLMHAELSRRLQTNEAEHQRLWDTSRRRNRRWATSEGSGATCNTYWMAPRTLRAK